MDRAHRGSGYFDRMATILIHAGMPKTGSTSLQNWFLQTVDPIREMAGFQLVREDDWLAGVQPLVPAKGGLTSASNGFVVAVDAARRHDKEELIPDLCAGHIEQLAAAADRHGDIFLTSEAFAGLIVEQVDAWGERLNDLAASHRVAVVLYFRPQHEALESRWRQWGYHCGLEAEEFVRRQLEQLDYAAHLDHFASIAPQVEVMARPYGPEFQSDVVADFATEVFGAPELAPTETIRANPSISLDLSILLHGAPHDVVSLDAEGSDLGRRQVTIAQVTADWESGLSARAGEVRQQWLALSQRYREGNDRIAARCGWGDAEFVPPTDLSGSVEAVAALLTANDIDPVAREMVQLAVRDLCLAHEAQ